MDRCVINFYDTRKDKKKCNQLPVRVRAVSN